MSDIDAKEILTRNIPLVVIYVLALVPILVWFGVMSEVKSGKKDSFKSEFGKLKRQAGKINQLAGQIKAADPNSPVFTESDVEAFGKRKELLQKQNASLGKLVSDRDTALKVWFPKWKDTGWDKEPEYTEYAEHWKEVAIPKLQEEFKKLVMPAEVGAESRLFGTAPPGRGKMRDAQKKFWIQKAILTALQEGGKTRTPTLNAVPLFIGGDAGSQSKPDDGSLYDTIMCTVDVTASLRDLPLILRAILAQTLPMQITGLNVQKTAFRYERPWKQGPNEPPLVDGADKFFQDHAYTAQLERAGDFNTDLETYIPEPPVQIEIKVAVFDFKGKSKPPEKK